MKQFDTVEKALDELKQGHLILVTDDEDRENEGDLICAASFATTENVNFMATHAKGLICMPMSAEICRKLQFPQITMRRRLPYRSTIKRRPPVFLPRSEVLRRARAWIRTQSRRISAARDICFR